MAHILLLAGSPGRASKSSAVLGAFGAELGALGHELEHFSLDDFEPDELLRGETSGEGVRRFLGSVERANGVVFSTPVYKATFAGSLKVMIDLIAPGGLAGKAALGIATARLPDHLVKVDFAFQRLFEFFQGSRGLGCLALNDSQLGANAPSRLELDAAARHTFHDALARFTRSLA